ncbi:hypothetical protein GJ496_002850, partial [Pomphorhynchus laevis]
MLSTLRLASLHIEILTIRNASYGYLGVRMLRDVKRREMVKRFGPHALRYDVLSTSESLPNVIK